MMVERKLSGVYMTMPVEVAFDHFDSYVDTLMEYMENVGIKKSRMEICDNVLVQQAFEKTLKSITEYIEFDEAYQYVNDDTVETCYKEELQEIRAREAEERRLAAIKQAEEARIKREQDALKEATITIDKKHLIKAVAILQAAGLIKKDQ